MRKIIKSPQVIIDLREIAEFIAADRPQSADRFVKAAERTFRQLATSPELGSLDEFELPSLAGIRRWRIRGFERYLVFYRLHASTIEIVRVIHGARDIQSLFPS